MLILILLLGIVTFIMSIFGVINTLLAFFFFLMLCARMDITSLNYKNININLKNGGIIYYTIFLSATTTILKYKFSKFGFFKENFLFVIVFIFIIILLVEIIFRLLKKREKIKNPLKYYFENTTFLWNDKVIFSVYHYYKLNELKLDKETKKNILEEIEKKLSGEEDNQTMLFIFQGIKKSYFEDRVGKAYSTNPRIKPTFDYKTSTTDCSHLKYENESLKNMLYWQSIFRNN